MKPIKIACTALALLLLTSCGAKKPEETTSSATTGSVVTDLPGGDTESVDTVKIYSGALQEDGGMSENALQYVRFGNTDLIGHVIPNEVWNIGDKDVEKQLATIAAQFADTTLKQDREIRMYDTVNIDYVGSIDGVEFSGGSTGGQGTDVTIGITSYIDDFLEQLIGHKPGETVNVSVTFPEDYGKEELNGKDALFVTTINYIAFTPELTDELVAEKLTYADCKTVAELEAYVRETLSAESIEEYVLEHLTSIPVSELPQAYVDYQLSLMLEYYRGYAESYGLDIDTFLSYAFGTTAEALKEEMRPYCEEQAHLALVVEAAYESLGKSVGEEELKEYFSDAVENGEYEEYLSYYGAPYLKQIAAVDLLKQYIIENSVRG
ncbi:MAG: FKBP-type peptidyl-prolyl cis-trans isomerase [Eubacteriales bacterium]|nr:FKBP-type peptidyl-prolyl cis-trans isomerase [Eubacteriales bacterium]